MSLLTTIGLALDRYLAISRPIQYRTNCSKKITFIVISSCWILALICSSLSYLTSKKEYYYWTSCCIFVISTVIFVPLNLAIYFKVKLQQNNGFTRRRFERELRLANTIRNMFLIYFLLLCPYFCVKFCQKILELELIFGFKIDTFHVFSRNAIISNSALNSTIYAFSVTSFRNFLKQTWNRVTYV